MVRVLVDHDLIARPVPAGDDVVIIRSDVPIEIIKPEAFPVSSSKHEYMFPPKATGEAPVPPCPIDAIMRIVGATPMSDPLIVPGVNVRKFRMPSLVRGNAVFGCRLTSRRGGIARRPGSLRGSRTVSRDVSATNVRAVTAAVLLPAAPPILCKSTEANQYG